MFPFVLLLWLAPSIPLTRIACGQRSTPIWPRPGSLPCPVEYEPLSRPMPDTSTPDRLLATASRPCAPSASPAPTVYLLGPAHFVPVTGVAVADFRAFMTPLGEIPVAVDIGAALVDANPLFEIRNDAHAPEHSLEVELPFLQTIWGEGLRVVCLLFGRVDPTPVGEVLAEFVGRDPESVVVVSSDLSHYHPYERARQLDTAFLQAVVAGDRKEVARGEACGQGPILALMRMAELLNWQPHLLDYRNSGDTAGDRRQVVGYGAVAYTQSPQVVV